MARNPSSNHALRVPPAAVLALACLGALVATGLAALAGSHARGIDETVLRGFRALDRGRTDAPLNGIAHLVDSGPYLVWTAALVLLSLRVRRRAVAVTVAIVLAGSATTTQVLKQALAQPRPADWLGALQISDASWPSGHATAAMALALCAVLVAPAALRIWVALAGGAFAAAVAMSILALGWHFPSDVLGGYLVAAVWALGAVAVLQARAPAARAIGWADVRLPALLGAVGAVTAVALRESGAAEVLPSPAKIAGALVIAAAAAVLPLAMSRAVGPR